MKYHKSSIKTALKLHNEAPKEPLSSLQQRTSSLQQRQSSLHQRQNSLLTILPRNRPELWAVLSWKKLTGYKST